MGGFMFIFTLVALLSLGSWAVAGMRDGVWLKKLEESGMRRVYSVDEITGYRTWSIELEGN